MRVPFLAAEKVITVLEREREREREKGCKKSVV